MSFQVAAGDKIGLVGRNGAGKSPVLKAVVGVLRPMAGSVRLAEHDVIGTGLGGQHGIVSGREAAATGQEVRLPEAPLPAIHGVVSTTCSAGDRVLSANDDLTDVLNRLLPRREEMTTAQKKQVAVVLNGISKRAERFMEKFL